MEAEKAKAEKSAESQGSPDSSRRQHSPRSVLEEMSLQQSMDKNKESLKRKLMMRRSVNELVDQGIYPPLKTPPSYAEQRKHLERAKTGDILRHKIQHRPDRNFLVQQHILEDTNIDRSLHERQRLLKRARLADNLNDKLLHRPGPLELLKGNILQSENNTFVSAIKDGVISFNNTCSDDESDSPINLLCEDDSNHSDIALSPPQFDDSSIADIGSPPIPNAPDLPKIFQTPFLKHSQVQTGNIVTKIAPITAQTFSTGSFKNGSSSNGKVRPKKQKPKTQSKAKVIKFHEYKGPPNIVKTAPPVPIPQPDTETPYNILLQQQQMFLQWQVKFQQENLNLPLLLPAPTMEVDGQSSSSQSSGGLIVAPVSTTSGSPPPPGTTIIQAQGSLPQSIMGSPQPAAIQQSLTPTIIQQHSPQLLAQPQPQISIPQAFTPTPVDMSSPPILSPPTPISVMSPPTPISVMSPTTPAPIVSPPTPTRAPTPQHIIQPPPTPIMQTQTVIPIQQPHIHLPTSKISTQSKPQSNFHSKNSKHSHSSTNSSVNKPLSNLEDMKVQALKAELKKRNLPVSGTKTHLIERLRPYEDVITGSAPGSVNTNESPVASVQPVQTVKTIVTVKPMVQDKKHNIYATPPMSPAHMDLMNPMSPEIIDMASPPNVTVGLTVKGTLSQNVPMVTDQSRPPSVAPVDAFMDIDSSVVDKKNSVKILAGTPPLQNSSSPAPIQAPASPQTAPQTPSPVVVSQLVSQDELLFQHQKKIEMLQKQLEESQFRLQLQQLQHQQLQQQQHQLKQQQQELQDIQKDTTLPKSNSSPQIMNAMQLAMPVEGNNQGQTSLGTNSGQIQIQSHILQTADQNTQGIPIIMQAMPSDIVAKQTKPNLVDFFKVQPLQQNVNNLGKPNVTVSTAPVGIHPFIVPSTPGKGAPVAQMNGITQNRTASLPGSPVEATQGLTRTVSNPFFTIRLKAPPEYDEAIKSKHQHNQNAGMSAPVLTAGNSKGNSENSTAKSQTMDDVLEILIRNGELPPSALLQDSLLAPKSTTQTKTMSSVSLPSSNQLPVDSMASVSGFFNFASYTFPSAMTAANTYTTSVIQESLPSISQMSAHSIKQEPVSPPPVTISVVEPSSSEILGLNDVLNQDLNTMDWTSDAAFTSMDLIEASGMSSDMGMKTDTLDDKTLLSIPTSCSNNQGSEPDLTALGLNDNDAPINMQVDISDWLDVHLPSTGLTPLSANAPVSFPSDPILTPKTQQEVLDLFNFDDADFNTPTDLQSGINWDKITETATSSS